jgi:hypothetical protein
MAQKVKPWTEPKMMYKDGNVDVYRKFNWETWKRMTDDERAMWTEQNEAVPAPISKEVIEFNKKAEVVEVSTDELDPTEYTAKDEREDLKAQLKDLGIYFHPNSKLETLRKKLADANDPE